MDSTGLDNAEAIEYLENHVDSVAEEPYCLAVATYALHLAGSTKAKHALRLLEGHRVPAPDGSLHWSAKTGANFSQSDSSLTYFYQPPPVNV